jgi:hypothetical protein
LDKQVTITETIMKESEAEIEETVLRLRRSR